MPMRMTSKRKRWLWGGCGATLSLLAVAGVGTFRTLALTATNQSTPVFCGMPDMGQPGGSGVVTAEAAVQPKFSLSAWEVAAQNHIAEETMHEHAMQPKVLPDGTKEFTLTASTFRWALWPGFAQQVWGYNHQTSGPLIRVRVGDKVAIVLHNHLPDSTTLHLDGLSVPNAMDGVPGVTQAPIAPGASYTLRFTVTPDMIGTHYYRSAYNPLLQSDHGLVGPIIVDGAADKHVAAGARPTWLSADMAYDVDALYVLGAWSVAGADDAENAFTMDGKACPYAPQLNVKLGQTVRIRLINTSAISAHSMHLHGYTFRVIALDGHKVANPPAQNTVTLEPGQTVDIAFIANHPGRWMFHCHILDHTMNPGDMKDEMGGLVTYVNVHR